MPAALRITRFGVVFTIERRVGANLSGRETVERVQGSDHIPLAAKSFALINALVLAKIMLVGTECRRRSTEMSPAAFISLYKDVPWKERAIG